MKDFEMQYNKRSTLLCVNLIILQLKWLMIGLMEFGYLCNKMSLSGCYVMEYEVKKVKHIHVYLYWCRYIIKMELRPRKIRIYIFILLKSSSMSCHVDSKS